MSDQIPFKPYMLRAFHEWLTEIGQTPHILVNCAVAGVNVPTAHIKDGRIILNISYSATNKLFINNMEITFGANFGNNQMQVKVPMDAVLAIYSRETGDSIPFVSTKAVKSALSSAQNEDSSEKPFQEPQSFLRPDSPKMSPEPDLPKNQTLKGGIRKGGMNVLSAKPKRDTSHLQVIK